MAPAEEYKTKKLSAYVFLSSSNREITMKSEKKVTKVAISKLLVSDEHNSQLTQLSNPTAVGRIDGKRQVILNDQITIINKEVKASRDTPINTR